MLQVEQPLTAVLKKTPGVTHANQSTLWNTINQSLGLMLTQTDMDSIFHHLDLDADGKVAVPQPAAQHLTVAAPGKSDGARARNVRTATAER